MATQDTPAAVSGMLLAAQERLLELRAAHQAAKGGEQSSLSDPYRRNSCLRSPAAPTQGSIADTLAALPPHLGWENPRLTENIRRALDRNRDMEEGNHRGLPLQTAESSPGRGGSPYPPSSPRAAPLEQCTFKKGNHTKEGNHRGLPLQPTTIKLYPDLALAMLHEKQTAAGRVWLLLRHLDINGRGWVSEAEAYDALASSEKRTAAGGPLQICGRRQLNNLLKQGDGLYWERTPRSSVNPDREDAGTMTHATRDEPRIWLRSVPRVAAALGVERLAIAPVAVDITELTGTIGRFRAHLYAGFHSGRQQTDFVTGRARPRGPIARETMKALSAVCPNSQRAYERRAGVGRKAAFAVGNEAPNTTAQTAESQETAWRHGRATFRLIDHDGRFGRPGRTYLAWQLPNEYTGPHQRLSRSRMKRMNRALADLLVNGMTGNDEHDANQPAVSSRPTAQPAKRFFGTAKAAWTAERQGKLPDNGGYWRVGSGRWTVVSDQRPGVSDQWPVASRQRRAFR